MKKEELKDIRYSLVIFPFIICHFPFEPLLAALLVD